MRKSNRLLVALGLLTALAAPLASPAAALADEGGGAVISVADYGAKPDSGEDSAQAIIKAIDKAEELSQQGISSTIVFPVGRYDIYPDMAEERELYVSNTVGQDQKYKMKKIGILLENAKNVTVDGQGSTFMFHGKMTTFAAIDCENITFTNFTVDFQVPTAIDLTVEKVEGNTATIYVPECYNYKVNGSSVQWSSDTSPYTGETYWTASNKLTYTQRNNTKTGLTWRGNTTTNPIFSGVKGIEDVGNNRLKFTYSNMADELKGSEGVSFQMRDTTRDHPGVFLWKSVNSTLRNVHFNYLHGFGIVGQSSDTLTFDNVDFEAPAESGRTTAGFADFMQMSGCKGQIEMVNCDFHNPHDDSINVHGTFMKVVQRISDTQVKVQFKHGETAGFQNYFVGDEVEFYDSSLVKHGETYTVTGYDGPDGKGGKGSLNSLTEAILTLDKPLHGDIQTNYAVEDITYTPDVHIHDCTFQETPTRGILCTTRGKVVIEDNLFDGLAMSSIEISCDANNWYESGHTEDVTISGNTFMRNGEQDTIHFNPTSNGIAGNRVHKKVLIEGNTVFTEGGCMVSATSVENMTIKGNTVYRQHPNDSVTLANESIDLMVGEAKGLDAAASVSKGTKNNGSDANVLFWFNYCEGTSIAGNVYDPGVRAAVTNANGSTTTVDEGDLASKNAYTAQTGTVLYESSDPSVAFVDKDGKVTGISAGEAVISTYVLSNGRRFDGATAKVTVTGEGTAEVPGGEVVDPGQYGSSDASLVSGSLGDLIALAGNEQFYFATTTAKQAVLGFEAAEGATASATFNGVAVKSGDVLTFTNGRSVVEIDVVAADGITTKAYRFVVDRVVGTPAVLSELALGTSKIGIEKNKFSYETSTMGSKQVISAKASDGVSKLQLFRDGKAMGEAQEGMLSQEVQLYQGVNVFAITVSDGDTTNSYTLSVTVDSSVYLSDMDWVSATSGDSGNPVTKDKSCGQNALTLHDGAQEVTFAKGIGTHADSRIVYDISGMAVKKFTAKVGIDRETRDKPQEPDAYFKVYVDGKLLGESELMKFNSAYHTFDIDIPEDAKQLELVVEKNVNTWSDHADWADAKLIGEDAPVKPTVDKTELQEAITAAVNHDVTGNTASSIAAFEAARDKAVEAARSVLDNADATQVDVNAAVDALTEAMTAAKGLLQARVSDEDLAEARKVLDAWADLDGKAYTETTWKSYSEALDAAKAVLEDPSDTTEAQLDELMQALVAAHDALVEVTPEPEPEPKPEPKPEVDRSKLRDAIDDAQNVDLAGYTTESVEAFKARRDEAVAAAQAVLEDESATQEQVDAAVEALTAAMAEAKQLLVAEEGETPDPEPTPTPEPGTLVKTGDDALLYVGAAAAAGVIALVAAGVVRRRRG